MAGKITNNAQAKAAGYNNYQDYLNAQKYKSSQNQSNPTPGQVQRQDEKKVAQQTGTTGYKEYYQKNPLPAPAPYTPPSSGGGGGGGGGYVAPTPSYDYSDLIEAMAKLNDDKYSQLRSALLSAKQRADEMANSNYQRNLRMWKRTYNGNAGRLNGAGLSNKFNLMASRDSAMRQNESDYQNNLINVQSNRYDDATSLLRSLNGVDQNTISSLIKYYL